MDELSRLADDIDREAKGALSDALGIALLEARRLSSGFTNPAQLKAMDHPYARRHGRIRRLPPEVINAQSGRFLRSWRTTQDGLSGTLTNDDPKGELLGRGTRLMLARPLPLFIAPVAEEALIRSLERRLEKL